jgi:hypothetical protein
VLRRLQAVNHQLVSISLFNARSLGNKSAAVSQLIVDNQYDVFAVVELWHDSSVTPSVIASTPNGYYVCDRPRPRTGNLELQLYFTAG